MTKPLHVAYTDELIDGLLRLATALDDDDNLVAFDGNVARDAALEIVTLRRRLSDGDSRWQSATGSETPEDAGKVICGLQGAVVTETVRADRAEQYAGHLQALLREWLEHTVSEITEADGQWADGWIDRVRAALAGCEGR